MFKVPLATIEGEIEQGVHTEGETREKLNNRGRTKRVEYAPVNLNL